MATPCDPPRSSAMLIRSFKFPLSHRTCTGPDTGRGVCQPLVCDVQNTSTPLAFHDTRTAMSSMQINYFVVAVTTSAAAVVFNLVADDKCTDSNGMFVSRYNVTHVFHELTTRYSRRSAIVEKPHDALYDLEMSHKAAKVAESSLYKCTRYWEQFFELSLSSRFDFENHDQTFKLTRTI